MDKQHIIDEIRRTAEDGVPLGIARFFKETGIKASDWQGKFWVRWGDAVKEAGFAPNQWQTAYPDEILLQGVVALTRALGHFPLKAEWQMKGHGDVSFPSYKALRRLGSREQLVARVREYCEAHALSDVLVMCPATVEADRAEANKDDSVETFGFVYLLKSGRYYKIGRSNAVGRRERELAIQLPDQAKTIHSIKTDDPVGIEDYWHRRFEAKRKNGEWFELDSSDVKAFKRRNFM